MIRNLKDLNPSFLVIHSVGEKKNASYMLQTHINGADGIMFQCPVCSEGKERSEDGKGYAGAHYIICWAPTVAPGVMPGPGRWELVGTSIEDLTLLANPHSVMLTTGCKAHFYVEKGRILPA